MIYSRLIILLACIKRDLTTDTHMPYVVHAGSMREILDSVGLILFLQKW